MSRRMSNTEVDSLLWEDGDDCGCPTCEVCRNLLDARRELAEAREELAQWRESFKSLAAAAVVAGLHWEPPLRGEER